MLPDLASMLIAADRVESRRDRGSMPVTDSPSPLIGRAPRMARLRDQIARVATTDFAVLIEGESGSGKELVARQIHERSARRERSVRCGQLRRHRRHARRGGAVRHRGSDGHRRQGAGREVRAGERGNGVPRRSRRPLPGGPGEAVAGRAGPGGGTCRVAQLAGSRRATDRGDQPQVEKHGRGAQLPLGPVLSTERGRDSRAAPCANVGPTSPCWPTISWVSTTSRPGALWHRAPWMPSCRTTGRETCASSAASSSMCWRSPGAGAFGSRTCRRP